MSGGATLAIDPEQVRSHWRVMRREGDVREVRVLAHVPANGYGGPATASGYFTDPEALVRELRAIGSAEGVYITQNPTDPDLLARANNRLKRKPKHTTADADVVRYAGLTVDCDPRRKAGISATDEELARALERRDTIVAFLADELCWPAPSVTAMSGNGGHATYRLDLPTEAGQPLVESALQTLDALFSTEDVSIDTTLGNPSRIVKLLGTTPAKGDPLPHRPHRMARGEVNADAGVVSEAQLRALVALKPEPTVADPASPPSRILRVSGAGEPYDVPTLLRAAGIGHSEHKRSEFTAYRLDRCLSSDAHTDGAAILQFTSGALAYVCHHNSCAGIGWRDIKPQLGLPETPSGGASDAAENVSVARRVGVAAESNALVFRSARDVADAVAEEVAWFLFGYVAEGAITEIDGKIKSAGKTTLATHACRAILDGRAFLGRETREASIVYLTEQSPATYVHALKRADLLDRDDFRILFWHDTIGAAWRAVVAAARAEAKRIGAGVLVVDTLPQFSGVKGDAENNSGAALEAMEPLQEAAAVDGLAVVILRHDRKSGGDVGDSGRGSSAFSGAVDVVLQLSRPEGQSRPGVRVIKALSRFDETPETLVIELVDGGYVALGDAEAVVTEEARKALLQAAPTDEAAALKEADLLAAAGVKRTVGQDVLREYLAEGRLCRIGAGKRGDPYRYWRVATDDEKPSAGTTGAVAESNGTTPTDANGHGAYLAEMLSAAPKMEVAAKRNRTLRASANPGPGAGLDTGGDEARFLSAATPTLGAAERNEWENAPADCPRPWECGVRGPCPGYGEACPLADGPPSRGQPDTPSAQAVLMGGA